MNFASRPFYKVADRILGSQFLEDIAEFFLLFQTMYDGLRRAGASRRPASLHDRRTTFSWSPRSRRRRCTRPSSSSTRSRTRKLPPRRARAEQGAARVPARPRRRRASPSARATRPTRRSPSSPVPTSATPTHVARVLQEIGESFLNFQVVAKREAEQRGRARRGARRRGHRALLRHRHLRPRRPAPAGRDHLEVVGAR